jgi:hypothetical protein
MDVYYLGIRTTICCWFPLCFARDLLMRFITMFHNASMENICTISKTSRSVLSDIKREAQPSVLCPIKHDNECFK